MKYRVRRKATGYMKGKYYLQKKFLWWWLDVQEEQICIDGLSWMERIWFNTPEEAREYLNPPEDPVVGEPFNH